MSELNVKPAKEVPSSSRGSKYGAAVDDAIETLKTQPAAVIECEDAKQATNVAASLKTTIVRREVELTVTQRRNEVYLERGKQPVVTRRPRKSSTPKKEAPKATARKKAVKKTTRKPKPETQG